MKLLPLVGKHGTGLFAQVDDDVFDYLSQWRWHLHSGYVQRQQNIFGTGRSFAVTMHEAVILYRGELRQTRKFIDHIDRNRLNNQSSNLRFVTRMQNNINATLRRDNTSGYKGVQNIRGRWEAHLKFDKVQVSVYAIPTAEEAAYIYDQIALQLHGDYAVLNVL